MGKKVVTIVGARPQFIKASVVSQQFVRKNGMTEVIIHTGQHYDENMSDLFFEELEMVKPAYFLGVGSGNHGYQTGRMLIEIEKILLQEKPDIVMVYGDTNSTMAGALAAAKLNIPLAHVEAGLRSFNKAMPEEVNRILTDHASNILFAPTEKAVSNLKKEGISESIIHNSGDVMYDASLLFGKKAEGKSEILENLRLEKKRYILSTIHRAENTNDIDRLIIVSKLLSYLSQKFTVVLPLHPRTKKIIEDTPSVKKFLSDLKIIQPVGYLDMLMLEKNAKLIATDSGGVQKEAFFFKVPCFTLRDETEWGELVELGWNTVLSPQLNLEHLLNMVEENFEKKGENAEPYGKGHAGEFIYERLLSA